MAIPDKVITIIDNTNAVKPSIQEYYINTSLYREIPLTQNDKDYLYNIFYTNTPIDCYCAVCKKDSVFQPLSNTPNSGGIPVFSHSWNPSIATYSVLVTKEFKCSRCSNQLKFINQIKNGVLSKIGQTPALAEIAEYDIYKYKKILDEHYKEFSKAVGLYAHGIGVGSFVYLRRIIENFIINPAHKRMTDSTGWDEGKYQASRFKEKIDLLKAELPEFLTSNKNLYSIISKGIHELNEEECLEYFPVLKNSIELVLDELESQEQLKKKRQSVAQAISDISSKHS